MKHFTMAVFVVLLAVGVTGCATVRLPSGPDIYSFSENPSAPTIVVAHPTDNRSNKNRLGSIGATQYSLKADPRDLVGKQMIAALHKAGFNGLMGRTLGESKNSIAQAIQGTNANAALALSIEGISIQSMDIILDPPVADVQLQAVLYDSTGKQIDSATATGHVQKRISMFAFESAAGELVAEAARDAAERLVGKTGLEKSLQKVASKR